MALKPADKVGAPELIALGKRMRGVRAGVIVFSGIALANAANAGFHLIAGRQLGPSGYGDFAALLALLGLFAFPLGGVQIAIAQTVARLAAQRDLDSIRALYRRVTLVGVVAGGALTVLLIFGSFAIHGLLDINSYTAVLLTALAVLPAVFAPLVAGLVQGLERFKLFSAVQVLGPVTRIVALVPLLAIGLGVAGAVGATLIAAVVAVIVPTWYLREWLRPSIGTTVATHVSLRSLLPVVLGILAFTSLTTVDIIVAKIAFTSSEAGIYGGASFVGRLVLYVPAAIVAVLLPKVSSRAALGRRSEDILIKSLGATAAVCVFATAIYALAPELILRLAFGQKYEAATDLLWLFGVSMTGFALLNVLFVYYIGLGRVSVSWLLCAGAVVQLVLFGLFHGSARELLAVSIVAAYSLLVLVALADRASGRGRAPAPA